MMNRPVDRITVFNRSKKNVKPNFQKGPTASECGVKSVLHSTSKENISTETPVMYDCNRVETLVGEERVKHTFPTCHEYELLKSSNEQVNFGGGNCGEFHSSLPRIVDLCLEDKKRILQLINELANCKEEKEILTKELNNLKDTVKQQDNEMKVANERFAAQKEALALEVENLVTSRDNLTSDIENLQNCVEIQKNEIEKQTSLITTLKSEKHQLQKQLLEYENKFKAVNSDYETLMERLLIYEPRSTVRNEQGKLTLSKTTNNKIASISSYSEKSRSTQKSDAKVEGCSGDAGTHILQEPMSCSACTDVGFFAVRMCPDLGSGAALVVCRPTDQKMLPRKE